jgi:hypothetical protein
MFHRACCYGAFALWVFAERVDRCEAVTVPFQEDVSLFSKSLRREGGRGNKTDIPLNVEKGAASISSVVGEDSHKKTKGNGFTCLRYASDPLSELFYVSEDGQAPYKGIAQAVISFLEFSDISALRCTSKSLYKNVPSLGQVKLYLATNNNAEACYPLYASKEEQRMARLSSFLKGKFAPVWKEGFVFLTCSLNILLLSTSGAKSVRKWGVCYVRFKQNISPIFMQAHPM